MERSGGEEMVYVNTVGPRFETRAEIRSYRGGLGGSRFGGKGGRFGGKGVRKRPGSAEGFSV